MGFVYVFRWLMAIAIAIGLVWFIYRTFIKKDTNKQTNPPTHEN